MTSKRKKSNEKPASAKKAAKKAASAEAAKMAKMSEEEMLQYCAEAATDSLADEDRSGMTDNEMTRAICKDMGVLYDDSDDDDYFDEDYN